MKILMKLIEAAEDGSRHSAATEYLRRGGNLGILSKILGHSDISTTAIYTHLLTEDMVKSYDQFSPANSLSV